MASPGRGRDACNELWRADEPGERSFADYLAGARLVSGAGVDAG